MQGAVWAMDYLTTRIDYDPFWEVLLPHAVYTSARMRAERTASYDTNFLLNLVVQDDKCPGRAPFRGGWGVEQDTWGLGDGGNSTGVDVDGLLGSVLDGGGYAFAMDTFALVAALLPVARYNASYARAIGKWTGNAANAARLFFPAYTAPDRQSDYGWVATNDAFALSYEGLRKWGFNETVPGRNNITGPYGTGDAKWAGQPTNLVRCAHCVVARARIACTACIYVLRSPLRRVPGSLSISHAPPPRARVRQTVHRPCTAAPMWVSWPLAFSKRTLRLCPRSRSRRQTTGRARAFRRH